MADPNTRGASHVDVLIAAHDAALAEVLAALLEDEGYAARRHALPADPAALVALVRERRPALLLLDLGGREVQEGEAEAGGEAYAPLDALRVDADTAGVPVLALSTSERVAQGALASYNVCAIVVEPFDLDHFLREVRAALNAPPLHADAPTDHEAAAAPAGAAPEGALALAGRLLAARSREVLVRWVVRLRREAPWAGRDDLGLGAVLDSMPVVVEALVVGLDEGAAAARFWEDHPRALERAQEHGRTRRGQGIGLVAVLREYAFLRDEVWALFRRHLPPALGAGGVLALAEVVNRTLDGAIEATAAAYLADGEQVSAAGTADGEPRTVDTPPGNGALGEHAGPASYHA